MLRVKDTNTDLMDGLSQHQMRPTKTHFLNAEKGCFDDYSSSRTHGGNRVSPSSFNSYAADKLRYQIRHDHIPVFGEQIMTLCNDDDQFRCRSEVGIMHAA